VLDVKDHPATLAKAIDLAECPQLRQLLGMPMVAEPLKLSRVAYLLTGGAIIQALPEEHFMHNDQFYRAIATYEGELFGDASVQLKYHSAVCAFQQNDFGSDSLVLSKSMLLLLNL
jgi:hypothetical protein